jgi:MFS transporter, putative metabolite:H+ symporter
VNPNIAAEGDARISARLDRLPISPWHFAMFAICAIGLLCDAADQLVIISIGPLLIRDWGITVREVGFIIAGGNIGGVVGAMLFGALADRIGRRQCLMICVSAYSVLTGCAAFSQNVSELIAIRFLGGIGLGGLVPVTLALVGEFAPPLWRGRLVAWWNSMFAFGLTVAGYVGVFVVVPFGWRWGFAVGTVPLLLVPFVAVFLPESVRFLVAQGRIDEARRTVERVERNVLGAARAAAVAAEPAPAPSVAAPLQPRVRGLRALKLLFAPVMRNTMMASAVLWFLPAAALLSSFYPIVLTQSRGMSIKAAIALVAASTVLGPLGQFIAGFLSDWWGRKASLTCALSLLAVAPLVAIEVAGTEHWIYLFLTLGFVATSATYGTLFGYTAEQLPTPLRGGGLGIFEGLRRLGGVIGPAVIGIVYTAAGIGPVLWGAFAACVLTVALMLMLGRETRGISLAKIDAIVR